MLQVTSLTPRAAGLILKGVGMCGSHSLSEAVLKDTKLSNGWFAESAAQARWFVAILVGLVAISLLLPKKQNELKTTAQDSS